MELRIDREAVANCRDLAAAIAAPVSAFIDAHSTVSVERAVLRLLGVDGVGPEEVPVANLIVDALSPEDRARGAALAFGRGLAQTGLEPKKLGEQIASGALTLEQFSSVPDEAAREIVRRYAKRSLDQIASRREERREKLLRLPQAPPPLLYVIVASGNIYEDRTAAVAAAEGGAQIIAVIRSTAARLRSVRPDHRRLRRHVCDASELQDHA
jgi:beta-lysine 5,6-aminomutase alpha subunit